MNSTEDDPKREALARMYADMPSAEIERRLAEGGLTKLAQHLARRELDRRTTTVSDPDPRVVLPPLGDPATLNLGPYWSAVVMWLGNAYGVWVWWSGFAPPASAGAETTGFEIRSLLGVPIACVSLCCMVMMPMLVRNTLWRIGVSLTLLALYLLLHGKPSIWVLAWSTFAAAYTFWEARREISESRALEML